MSVMQVNKQFDAAITLHRSGDLAGAANAYSELLEENPRFADAWHLSGVIALQQKAFDNAEQLILKALILQPGQPVYLSNLAATLLAMDRLPEAENAARQGLNTDPTNIKCRKRLVSALARQQRHADAASELERLVSDDPDDADALNNLGAVLIELQRYEQATNLLLRARLLSPDSVQVRLNLGAALHESGRLTDALTELDRAVELGPDVPECWINRGNTRLSLGESAGALADFQQAVTLHPQSAVALNGLGRTLQVLGHWNEALEALNLACRLDGPLSRYESNRLYCASLAPNLDRTELFRLHEAWGKAIEERTPMLPAVRYAHERTRVGYVSPDFYDHATMRFFLPLLEAHDCSRFDVYCYFEGQEDAVSQRVNTSCRAWRPTVGMSDADLAAQIRHDEIDILIDLAGHTAGNRLPVFAAKAAPVQVSFLGYPNTTGLRRISYFLTDAERESPATEDFFTEQPVYLPRGACCFEAPSSLPVAEPPHLSTGSMTFGSAHRLEKMSPDCLALWGRVLEQNPDARLLLLRDVFASAATRERLTEQLQAAGVDVSRVDYAWELPTDHLEIYARFDILLDVFPWGSGATAYESMWMGVPIPTIRGDRGSCRATASLMHNCGLPELCADTPDDYVRVVTQLAADSEQLLRLRHSIRPAMQQTVCNGEQFARDIENAFTTMLADCAAVREAV